jgi:hypothetical protein
MSKEKKIKRKIESLKKIASKHRAIFVKARDKAEKLEEPLILAELKEKYEKKYFAIPNGVDDIKWTTYVYCIEVSSFIKGRDFIHANGRIIMFDDMGKKGISIRKTDTEDIISHYCKKEVSQTAFLKGAQSIITNLLSEINNK